MPITDSVDTNMHPTISGEWVLYTKGVRGKQTRVRVYNRSTGETRQVGSANGRRRYVYSGQVAGNWAVWGRVLRRTQDVFLTNLASGKTVMIKRKHRVTSQYNPAVTPRGTVFFQRNKPCVRHCPKLNTPAAVNQLVEQLPGGRQRVVATLRKGQDGGFMYAASQGNRTQVLYSRFRWFRHSVISYGDIFGFTVTG